MKNSWSVFLVICLIFLLSGCAGNSYQLNGTTMAPASAGTVQVKQQDQNSLVRIEVQHLPKPEDLQADLSTYVVWLRPLNGTHENQGQIVINDERKGQLEIATPHPAFDVLVTAENHATVGSPSEYVVLTASVEP